MLQQTSCFTTRILVLRRFSISGTRRFSQIAQLPRIEDLDAKYLAEVEKLALADENNLQVLEKLRAEYNSTLQDLINKDLATEEAIANLDAKLLAELEKLVKADENNLQALEQLKAEAELATLAYENAWKAEEKKKKEE